MRTIAVFLVLLALELVPGCGSATLRGVQSAAVVGDAVWYVMTDDHNRVIVLRCVDDGHAPVCQQADR
jgi:hypothetical protein